MHNGWASDVDLALHIEPNKWCECGSRGTDTHITHGLASSLPAMVTHDALSYQRFLELSLVSQGTRKQLGRVADDSPGGSAKDHTQCSADTCGFAS